MSGSSYGMATTALLRLAERADTFSLTSATVAVLGRDGNQAERNRVASLAWKLVDQGKLLKVGRGRYKSAIEKPPPIDVLGVAAPRPMGPAAVRDDLNQLRRAATVFFQFLDEKISEAHRANGSANASAPPAEVDRPTSFPMRFYASTQTVTVRRQRQP